jgi:hypothetical protein
MFILSRLLLLSPQVQGQIHSLFHHEAQSSTIIYNIEIIVRFPEPKIYLY